MKHSDLPEILRAWLPFPRPVTTNVLTGFHYEAPLASPASIGFSRLLSLPGAPFTSSFCPPFHLRVPFSPAHPLVTLSPLLISHAHTSTIHLAQLSNNHHFTLCFLPKSRSPTLTAIHPVQLKFRSSCCLFPLPVSSPLPSPDPASSLK